MRGAVGVASDSGSPGAPRPRRVRPKVGEALGALFSGAFRRGWQNLLELVLLGLLWSLGMVTIGLGLIAPGILARGGGLILAGLAVLLPLAVAAPATLGLFTAVDLIWAGEAVGPFDAVRNFFRGFRHRYWRSVGLGALWALVILSLYANTVEDRHLLPAVLTVGVGVLLLYVALFVVMVNVYLIPILALTEWHLWRCLRVAAWQAVANPMFTLSALLVPGAVVILGGVVRPVLPLLVGGITALFSTGAARLAPLRHPDLPPPTSVDQPLEDEPLELRPGVDFEEVSPPSHDGDQAPPPREGKRPRDGGGG